MGTELSAGWPLRVDLLPDRDKAKGLRGGFDIPSLDGIRALSFLVVFGGHALPLHLPARFGVTVFFFLSGFLITTLMRREAERMGTVSFRAFYLRRALRILPPFYLVLALAVTASALHFTLRAVRGTAISALALHMSNYYMVAHPDFGGLPEGTEVYWSLAVEEHFYLLFPLVYVVTRRLLPGRRAQASALWGMCGLVLIWRCVLVFGMGQGLARTLLATDTRIDAILSGCALAVWGNPSMDDAPEGHQALWRHVLLPAGAGILAVTFAFGGVIWFRDTVRYTIQSVCLVPLFVCAVRWPRWGIFRVLSWAPIKFVGTLSYTLYLLHVLVLDALGDVLGVRGYLRAGIALALCLIMSYGIHLAVEQPAARLRRRLHRENIAPPASPTKVRSSSKVGGSAGGR